MGHFINWLANTIAIMVAAYLLPGVHLASIWTAFVISLIIGISNALIRPMLFSFSFRLTTVTFGLFLLVVNSLLIIMASHIVPGFGIDSYMWAFFFSALVSFINLAISRM
jgi:putative membrane protein